MWRLSLTAQLSNIRLAGNQTAFFLLNALFTSPLLQLPSAHPQVSISQVCSSRVGSIDGLFAINLDDAAVLDVPDVLQLVEDVACLVLDQDGRVG